MLQVNHNYTVRFEVSSNQKYSPIVEQTLYAIMRKQDPPGFLTTFRMPLKNKVKRGT
jgi:hypothetical protein